MAYIDRSTRLLFEKGMAGEFVINGCAVSAAAAEPDNYFDHTGQSLPIGRFLRYGENVIEGLFVPEMFEQLMAGPSYNRNTIRPTLDIFLVGNFGVSENSSIVQPALYLAAGAWRRQGYPYYAKAGVYLIDFVWQEKDCSSLWLEADTASYPLEVRLNGRVLA